MLTRARLFSQKTLLSLMSSAYLLRRTSISTSAFLSAANIPRTSTTVVRSPPAAATPLALATITMGKQSLSAPRSSRQASSRPFCRNDRDGFPIAPRARQLPSARLPQHVLACSSSANPPPTEHDTSPPSGAAPTAAATTATAAPSPPPTGGEGFGATAEGKKTGQQQQQHTRPTRPRQKPQPKAPPRGNNLLVVGLGNPGDKYKMTRHNAGFLVAEELARRYGGMLKIKTAFQGEYCSVTIKGKSIGILRPITYMNNSGMSARKVMDYFKLPVNAAIVLVDEVALDFGQLRLKGKGGPGGHNGLKSIQAHLKTPEYPRLRIGVGASKSSEALSDHVLGEFTRTEKKELDSIIADACDAVEHWIEEDDMGKVMTRFNTAR